MLLWMFCAVSVRIFVFWCCYVWYCIWWFCYINPIVLLYFLLPDICYILFFVILSSTEKNKAKRIVCGSPSLFILSVLCVVVSISGRLYFCIFSCDPLLFLSAVLCPSPQAIGGFAISLCCLVGWSEAYKIFVFWQSHDGILFIVLCVLLLCCVFSAVCSGSVWSTRTDGETYPGWFTFL